MGQAGIWIHYVLWINIIVDSNMLTEVQTIQLYQVMAFRKYTVPEIDFSKYQLSAQFF